MLARVHARHVQRALVGSCGVWASQQALFLLRAGSLQVPPEHCNVLEVSYKLPGYLATGVSGELTLTFAPKANEDIETALEMLADTGPFMVPVGGCRAGEIQGGRTWHAYKSSHACKSSHALPAAWLCHRSAA